jgi:hypothetical protein
MEIYRSTDEWLILIELVECNLQREDRSWDTVTQFWVREECRYCHHIYILLEENL